MPRRSVKKFTASEYEIIKAMVTSLSYAEIARKTGFTIPYVSRKVKDMYGKIYYGSWFNFRAIGLTQVFIEADYDQRFVEYLSNEKPPYMLSASRLFNGKRDRLLMYFLLPEVYVNKVYDAVPLNSKEIFLPEFYYRWRPDEAALTRLEGGNIVGDLDSLPDVYQKPLEREEPSPARMLLDQVDAAIISKLMQNPFTSLVDVARILDLRQQVVSYHFLRHVKPLWLYNVVSLDFNPEERPVKVFDIVTASASAAQRLAACLVQTPYFQSALVSARDLNRVIAFASIPGNLELKAHRALRRIPDIEDYKVRAIMETDVQIRWGFPTRGVIQDGMWIIDPLLEKLRPRAA